VDAASLTVSGSGVLAVVPQAEENKINALARIKKVERDFIGLISCLFVPNEIHVLFQL
jgi:hypothetical protein